MKVNNNVRAPLWETLEQYANRRDVSFHVPGHKDGAMYDSAPSSYLREAMRIDATEITGLDDLHHPEGAIKEAQEQASALFGSEETFFLVGGSTSGNLALILTVCSEPGDVILVQRNVHKSVIHGMMLARAKAVFLTPEVDGVTGLATVPSTQTVQEALQRYPEAKAVLLTHPNYYGMGTGLAPYVQLCHRVNVPLLVDEAHGAHFGLASDLPPSALSQGADGVVQSTHKMLGALTMGAMLHVRGQLLNRSLLKQRLAMIQSSSPSYLIMASLDYGRAWIEQRGEEAFTVALAEAIAIRAEIGKLKWICYISNKDGSINERQISSNQAMDAKYREGHLAEDHPGWGPSSVIYSIQDPFKLVLFDRRQLWSGYKLQEKLECYGCVPEMSDERYTVLALGPGTQRSHASRLISTLKQIEEEMNGELETDRVEVSTELHSQQVNNGSQRKLGDSRIAAFYEEQGEGRQLGDSEYQMGEALSKVRKERGQEAVELSTWNISENEAISEPVMFSLTPIAQDDIEEANIMICEGRVAAEMVIPYPPGIPLLYAGEVITSKIQRQIVALKEAGARFQAACDPNLNNIQVYKIIDNTGGKS